MAARVSSVYYFIRAILAPESNYYLLAIIYGMGISLLSLATPVSVQMLINTVANTGLTTPLVVLSLTLFALLAIASALNAMRIYLMDLFARRFYARMVAEISLRTLYAVNPYFEDHGQGALFNRYFDIIIVHKTLPYIVVSGFTVVLQVLAGFVLVSFYHPFFMVFSLLCGLAVWLIWSFLGRRAVASAVELSHRKHAVAEWLEALGASNGFFKSARQIDEALERTEAQSRHYIEQHQRHFNNYFIQTLLFLLVYSLASALLLGIGGWLVTQGQLSLGQLVAAELVLSVAFFGISQLGIYVTYFYDLCGAIDELSMFLQIEQEQRVEEPSEPDDAEEGWSLSLMKVRGKGRSGHAEFDLRIPAGARVQAWGPGLRRPTSVYRPAQTSGATGVRAGRRGRRRSERSQRPPAARTHPGAGSPVFPGADHARVPRHEQPAERGA